MNLKQTKEFSIYLEIRRDALNLTQESFVSNIVSVRQYRRYLRGLSQISDAVIKQFALRLESTKEILLSHFEETKVIQKKTIVDFHNSIVNYDYKEASLIQKKINFKHIIEDDSLLVYRFSLLVERFQLKKLTDVEFVHEIETLVDYPNVLKLENLSSTQVLVVSSLVGHQAFSDHEKLIERLVTYTKQTDVLYSNQIDRHYVLTLYRIAKYRGIHHEDQKVIELCDLGLEYSTDRKSLYMLDYFYYFKALAYYELHDMNHYAEMVFKCYGVIHSTGTPAKIKKFQDMIEKDFDISLDDFVIDYIKQKRFGH
jgi:hypothetical protein